MTDMKHKLGEAEVRTVACELANLDEPIRPYVIMQSDDRLILLVVPG